MNPSNNILNDLVSATRDGQGFYQHAATRVDDIELKALFVRIAKVKGDIVKGLSSQIRAVGDTPAKTGTWSGDVQKLYGDVLAKIGDKKHAYVDRLEDSEDRLLKAFEKALSDPDTSASAHEVITRYMPEVRGCHEIMRERKIALKKAA